jgi:catechol 2,3-dioxygenase-like lactoylglutathione lyase family enzyme
VRETAVPILPSRDLRETRAFYERLGFAAGWWDPDGEGAYAILRRGDLELHFFGKRGLDPYASDAGCYWRVADADAWHREAAAALDIPDRGIPRITPPEDRPWGVREWAMVDPSGNLVRVGHLLPAAG